MSLPSSSNDYAAPNGMLLGKAEWDAALTSIGARLRTLEAAGADLQELMDDLTATALATIAQNVAPQLAALQAAMTTLNTQIAAAEDEIAALAAGGFAASTISVATIAGLSATNVQAALAELQGDVTGINGQIADLPAQITRASGAAFFFG